MGYSAVWRVDLEEDGRYILLELVIIVLKGGRV